MAVETEARSVARAGTLLREAKPSEVEDLCCFLAQNMGRGMSAAQYLPIFHYPWLEEKPSLGLVLEDKGRIVGFLGAIYADRIIEGQRKRFCNLTNWCVLPEYRRHSVEMLIPILRDKDVVYTDLSPVKTVERLLGSLKFSRLSRHKWFSPPLIHSAGLFRACQVRTDRGLVDDLTPLQAALWRDHQGIGCQHTLLLEASHSCYVVSKARKKKGLRFSEILYASDAATLQRHYERLKLSILARDRTTLLACDENIFRGHPQGAIPYSRVTMFRSSSLSSANIDSLYSEIALL